MIKAELVSNYCVFDHTGGPNSKDEGRGDMGGLKRSYEMMDVGMSRVQPIRDSLSASEGKHNMLFFILFLSITDMEFHCFPFFFLFLCAAGLISRAMPHDRDSPHLHHIRGSISQGQHDLRNTGHSLD